MKNNELLEKIELVWRVMATPPDPDDMRNIKNLMLEIVRHLSEEASDDQENS